MDNPRKYGIEPPVSISRGDSYYQITQLINLLYVKTNIPTCKIDLLGDSVNSANNTVGSGNFHCRLDVVKCSVDVTIRAM